MINYLYIVSFILYGTQNIICQSTENPEPDCDETSLEERGLVFGGNPHSTLYYQDETPRNISDEYFVSCNPNKINFTFYDNNKIQIQEPNDRYLIEREPDYSSILLTIVNITIYDTGIYTLEARIGNNSGTRRWNITVEDPPSPVLYLDEGKKKYVCNVTGYPRPEVNWFVKAKNSNVSIPVSQNITIWNSTTHHNWTVSYYIYANQTELKDFEYLSCVGKNEIESNTAEIRLPEEGTESTNNGLIIAIIILLLLIVIICTYLCYKFYAIIEDRYYSAWSKFKPGIKLHVAGLLPSYGDLFTKGTFSHADPDYSLRTNQRVEHTSKMNDVRKLVAELNTISSLGRHLNIIRICDVRTEGRINGELTVSKEKCEYGNILKYVQNNKETLVMAANKPIPRSEGTGLLLPHYSTVSAENPLYNSWCTQDWLTSWAFQVACGMAFLESQDIFYKSTEDVLLSENGIVKITKFCHREQIILYEPTKKVETLEGSDFRSYAVFLRQLFSLADAPESGVGNSGNNRNPEHIELVSKENDPKYANEQIREVMLQCQNNVPGSGMQFSQIARTLEGFNHRVHSYYTRLNDENIQYNSRHASSINSIKVAWDEKRNASHKYLLPSKCFSQEVA